MPEFSQKSATALATCDPKIQLVFNKIILVRDCTVIYGHRGKEEQDLAYRTGKSKKPFPHSKHNSYPSLAIDVIPYPFKQEYWNDRTFWVAWSSWVKGFALGCGVELISGYDWDNDNDYSQDEQTFWDGPHFELVSPKGEK